jgi:uncharacterized tellurite resistance protein B-like protein
MTALEVLFGQDQDGTIATLRFRGGGDAAEFAGAPVEVALLLAKDTLGEDPVLTLRSLPELVPRVRSEPLPGALFLRLRAVWEARQAEGFRVEVGPEEGSAQGVESARFALDFGGHLARGRAHEVAGRLSEALAEYEASDSPTRVDEVARVKAALAGTSTPEERLVDEEAVLEILRAIAADGKVDAAEMQTLKALGQCFGLTKDSLQGYIERVRKEQRPADGAPMVAAEVMRDLFRKAAGPGRVGPRSSQTLKRAAQALGLTVAQVKEIVSGR